MGIFPEALQPLSHDGSISYGKSLKKSSCRVESLNPRVEAERLLWEGKGKVIPLDAS